MIIWKSVIVFVLSITAVTDSVSQPLDCDLEVGDRVGVFPVTKVAGVEDGVAAGQQLCYVCRAGGRPIVMTFVRNVDQQVTQLAAETESIIARSKDTDKDMDVVAMLCFIGAKPDQLQARAASFADSHTVTHTAVVVPKRDHDDGPRRYGIPKEANVAIVLCRAQKVEAIHLVRQGDLDEVRLRGIVKAIRELVQRDMAQGEDEAARKQ